MGDEGSERSTAFLLDQQELGVAREIERLVGDLPEGTRKFLRNKLRELPPVPRMPVLEKSMDRGILPEGLRITNIRPLLRGEGKQEGGATSKIYMAKMEVGGEQQEEVVLKRPNKKYDRDKAEVGEEAQGTITDEIDVILRLNEASEVIRTSVIGDANGSFWPYPRILPQPVKLFPNEPHSQYSSRAMVVEPYLGNEFVEAEKLIYQEGVDFFTGHSDQKVVEAVLLQALVLSAVAAEAGLEIRDVKQDNFYLYNEKTLRLLDLALWKVSPETSASELVRRNIREILSGTLSNTGLGRALLGDNAFPGTLGGIDEKEGKVKSWARVPLEYQFIIADNFISTLLSIGSTQKELKDAIRNKRFPESWLETYDTLRKIMSRVYKSPASFLTFMVNVRRLREAKSIGKDDPEAENFLYSSYPEVDWGKGIFAGRGAVEEELVQAVNALVEERGKIGRRQEEEKKQRRKREKEEYLRQKDPYERELSEAYDDVVKEVSIEWRNARFLSEPQLTKNLQLIEAMWKLAGGAGFLGDMIHDSKSVRKLLHDNELMDGWKKGYGTGRAYLRLTRGSPLADLTDMLRRAKTNPQKGLPLELLNVAEKIGLASYGLTDLLAHKGPEVGEDYPSRLLEFYDLATAYLQARVVQVWKGESINEEADRIIINKLKLLLDRLKESPNIAGHAFIPVDNEQEEINLVGITEEEDRKVPVREFYPNSFKLGEIIEEVKTLL